jgi:excisionase family DNA binding protein
VWKLDRLVRRSVEFERLWASCETAEVSLASVTEPIDTSNELGLAIVRILVTFAGLESSTKSMRLQAAYRAAALAGERPHANQRPYGLSMDWSTVVPEEAAIVREAAARVLHGESVGSLVRDFAARGVRGARGGVWSESTLRALLCRPSLAGLRTYHGEIVAKGSWPAVLDDVTSARLRLHFADPARRRDYCDRPPAYLLTGFLRCGNCGARMKIGRRGSTLPRQLSYVCTPKPRGCNGVSIRSKLLDELVTAEALRRISQLRSRALHWHRRVDATDPALAEALERHRVDLERAAHDYYVRHLIEREQFLAVRDSLYRALAQERTELLPLRAREMFKRLGLQAPLVAWNNRDIVQRREMLAVVLDHVVVDRAPSGGRFHPERVEMFWLGQGTTRATSTRAVRPPRRRRTSRGDYFTSKQAAEYLGLNDEYVTLLIRRGDLEATRSERGWKITQAAIDAFLEERRHRATQLVAP